MHAKMKENRSRLNDELSKIDDTKTKLNVLQVRNSGLGDNKSRIVLPKIRDKTGLMRSDGTFYFLFVFIIYC